MQATKRPGLVEKSHGEETKQRNTCGKLPPYHVISCIPRLITGVHGIVTEGALSVSVRVLTEHGIYPCHAQRRKQPHGGDPASSQEPQGVEGSERSRHLQDFVESIAVNVGGLQQDAKVRSPPMTTKGVGGVIVLGRRESRPQGEGRQESRIPGPNTLRTR